MKPHAQYGSVILRIILALLLGLAELAAAYIELQVPGGGWAVVQWQDSSGGWHEVEGWQGGCQPAVAGEFILRISATGHFAGRC